MSETQLMVSIQEVVNVSGRARVWRNNTGALPAKGRGGRTFPIRYGLGVGGADLVGLVLGSGRFFALEVKLPGGTQSAEQIAWGRGVEGAGGFYRVVHSVDDAMLAVRDAAVPQ
jgi:hypothetical protein